MNKSLLTGAVLAAAIMLAAPATYGQGVTLDLGKTETGRYLNLVGNTAGSDGELTDMVYIAPEYAARNKGTSMYFDIDDSLFYKLPAGWHALVNVEYYDAPGVQIKLVYDATGDHAGKEHAQVITTTGTNTWKSKSFTLDDACFGNGLAHGADFKLVAAAGDTMTINAVSVIPFEAYIDYGSFTDSLYLIWTERQGGDSHTQIVTKEGEECVSTIGINQYLYVNVDCSFLCAGKPTSNVFLTIEYYDSDAASTMRLQYDANTVPANAYKSTPYISGKGRNSFRTWTFELPDAYFASREAGGSDFRLCIPTPGLALNRILIARPKMKPFPPPANIANTGAYKAVDAPKPDGSLAEWKWVAPCAVAPQYNPDSTRSDEFYRTWFQNPANVPVAEAGESGITDPGIPGRWDPKDLSGGVRVQWDDENLYIAASIKDNVVTTSGTAWNTKDGFGFLIDCSHDYNTAGTAPIPRKDDQRFTQGEHFFFFPAGQGQAGTWRHSSSQEGEALPDVVKKAVVITDSGYVIEASVPLNLIADGLTWHPGVTGDKDAFNPLFAWMVNDNDCISVSSGRVMYGGHSEDDEFWGTLTLNPIPLVDHGIMIDLGDKNYENFLKQVETQAGSDGVTSVATRAGTTGRMLTSGYLYLDIEDTIWNAAGHKHALVSIQYFDSAAIGSRFRLQYDADTNAYTSTPYIEIGNTRQWKTAIIEVENARFESRQNGHADLRIASSTGAKDVIINQVKVAMADLWIDLGDTTVSHGIKETSLGGDGRRSPVTVGGVNCKRNDIGGIIASRYFYHSVADSLIYNGNHPKLFMTVEYYDTTCSGGLGMNYDAKDGSIFSTAIGDAYILGERQWKLHTFYIPDARFMNRMSGGDDFRIASKGDGPSFINRILIGSLDGIVTSVESRRTEPLKFALSQNYPNPFNPMTTIAFSLSSRSFVSLKVFDIMGREVATIASEDMPAGNHSRLWNASGYPSGVYFYRLQAGAHVETKRLILVK